LFSALQVISSVEEKNIIFLEAVTGSWRKLHDDELHDLYSVKYYICLMDGLVACRGERCMQNFDWNT
jgi:hypothetical protein